MAKEMLERITEGVKTQLHIRPEGIAGIAYDRTYTLSSVILLFFSVSFIGWVWECLLHIFLDQALINRGTMWGPWLPIYGVGSVLVIVALKRYSYSPGRVFLMAYVGSAILEYTTGWILETFRGVKYWDYSQSYFDIQGRICLEVLLLFATGACVILYVAAPVLDSLFLKVPRVWKNILCVILISAFIFDLYYSYQNPKIGEGITLDLSETYPY